MATRDYSSSQLFSCKGLVAVVTGGGSGIGAIMAHAFARNGAAKVFILGRRLDKLQEVASKAEGGEGVVVPVECDATSKDSLEVAAKRIADEVGFVNLLCVNHGITGPLDRGLQRKPDEAAPTVQEAQKALWSTSLEDFTDTFKVNVASVHFTTIAFLDLLDKGNKKGNLPKQTSQVIITSSIAGLHRSWTFAGMAYITSKAAVTHLAKGLAAYLIQFKIRVNVVAPGIFPSEMTQKMFEGSDMRAEGAIPASIQPLTRSGREEEMAGTILYLASEAGAYVSGSLQVLDGGRLGVLPGTTY